MGRFFNLATILAMILASLPFYWYSLSAAATANAFIRCQYTTGTAKSEPFSSRPLFPAPLDKQIIHHHRTDLKKSASANGGSAAEGQGDRVKPGGLVGQRG